ncbi:hypothetical protein ACTFIR_004636 [Dictyostelium discoideum]
MYNNKLNGSTSNLIENDIEISNNNNNNCIRNSIILKKHIIRNKFDNSSFPNQLNGIINDIDYHQTIESINNFKPKRTKRFNILFSISYIFTFISFFLAYFFFQDDMFFIFFPFSLIFLFICKYVHSIKYVVIVNEIETFHVGINESYEKYYNVTFTPHFQKTSHRWIIFDILSPGNYVIEQNELVIEYPVSKIVNSAISENINGANVVGSTSLQNSSTSPFNNQRQEINEQMEQQQPQQPQQPQQ